MRLGLQIRRGVDDIFRTQLTEGKAKCSRMSQLFARSFGALSALSWVVWAEHCPRQKACLCLGLGDRGKNGVIPEALLVELLQVAPFSMTFN